MPDIFHDVPISAAADAVFDAVSTPEGLSRWWAESAAGERAVGSEYDLHFGPQYHWQCIVTTCDAPTEFEIEMTQSDADWYGTRVGFHLAAGDGNTMLQFRHLGWPENNDHFRVSSYCWAMYLRCLKRYCEHGEVLPSAARFNGVRS